MHAHKTKVTIPANHRIAVELPADFPSGPAEVIVLAMPRGDRRVVALTGVLAEQTASLPVHDIVDEALNDLRKERSKRVDAFEPSDPTEKK